MDLPETVAASVNPAKPQKTVHDWIRGMQMSAEVNKSTVGVETTKVTPELLMAASRKLLGISRKEQEPDAKDSLLYQRFYGPAEYFSEHILRDSGQLGRGLLWKATNRGNVDFMPTAALDNHVSGVFYDSKLAQLADGSSPLDTIDAAYKTTRIGEGGIGDMRQAPDEMRLVQPSYFGYIDPTRAPESYRVGLDMYFSKNCMKGSDGKLYAKFIDARTGKEVLVDSATASKSVVATSEMRNADTKSIFALGGKYGCRIVPKNKVDYYLPHADDAYSTAANMVSMLNGVKDMRLLMGCLYPDTPLLVCDKDHFSSIIPAVSSGSAKFIPGADSAGFNALYPVRNSIAKLSGRDMKFRKVVLKSGRSLITSPDHRWPVLKDGKIELKRADQLERGDVALRGIYSNLPVKQTFILGKRVTPEVAEFVGCIARSLTVPDIGKYRVCFEESQRQSVEHAVEKLGIKGCVFYRNRGELCLAIRDNAFIQWIDDNIGVELDTRKIPPCILSARAAVAASFVQGYTANKNLIGIDSNEDIWILQIPNMMFRDALTVLLARCSTDTLYRDAVRKSTTHLALKLIPWRPDFGELKSDEIVLVQEIRKVPLMIDIDINDNMYLVGNGILTHNSKYPLQAVSLDNREAPLVRSLDEASGKSMQQLVSKYLGARYTQRGGTVSAVRRDRVDMIYDDGTKGSIDLYQNYPANSKGFLHNTPVVKAGQHLEPGQLVASSNYTDKDGTSAIGVNLRSAWLSWKGGTYEDAIAISESAAKKLTSTTMYKTAVNLDKSIRLGKQLYNNWKPGTYSPEQQANLDDQGIVKPGSVLHKGDPMILAVQSSEPSPGTMGKRVLTDISETWEHAFPGVVTDVVQTKKGVQVFATVTAPAQVGDKLATGYGNKGVISKIIPDDQMPATADGKPLDVLFSPLGLITRCYDEQTEFLTKDGWKFGKDVDDSDELYCFNPVDWTWEWGKQLEPFHKSHYSGQMYHCRTKVLDFCVTPHHKVYASCAGYPFKELRIEDVYGRKDYRFPCVGTRKNNPEATPFYLPPVELHRNHEKADDSEMCFDPGDWAEFLGWYLSEGNTTYKDKHPIHYVVNIAQSDTVHPGNVERIAALLDRLGLTWNYGKDNKQFHIGGKRLASYMRQFGLCHEKHAPDWLFHQPSWIIKRFLESLWMGDGRVSEVGKASRDGHTIKVRSITLASERLIDQIQMLYAMLGVPSTKKVVKRDKRYTNSKQLYTLGVATVPKNTRSVHTRNWSMADYNGMVYCPTVPTGYIMTRRNGKIICLGNTNSAVAYEALLGKIARKTGKPYTMEAFHNGSLADFVKDELKRAHLKDADDLVDPETGRKIPKVLNGVSYIYKLKHLADTKMSARGTDQYTSEGTPMSGGYSGGKRYGLLETSALVGHNAMNVINDAHLIRGQNNTDFWRSIRTGEIPVVPGEPEVNKKFFAHLQAAGVNVRKTPTEISVFALSNQDVDKLAGPREVKTRDTYETKNFRPIDGGLFGQDIFGINGDRWGYIKLDEPMPNPVMEDPLARLLNIPVKQFAAVAAGKAEVNGMKSGADIKKALEKINLDAAAREAEKAFKNAPASKRDAALKRYTAIERMRRSGVQPADYMLDKIPVLPPMFRPVTTAGGMTMVADSNYLYAQLLDARDDMREAKNLPDEYQADAREQLYNSWKELTGLYDPSDVKLRNKNVQGLLRWALGSSPKFSAVQRKIIGSAVDTVGRGVIVPDSRLKLNQVGLPEDMAFDIFAPFVTRKLVQANIPLQSAMKAVKERNPMARAALLEVMKNRPVQMNRAPSLHKLSIMGFSPTLVSGHAIHINPSIVVPFTADFDGDQVNIHAPVSDQAVRDTKERMFPERNLIAMSNRKILYRPEKEYTQGLYAATRFTGDPRRPKYVFNTLEEARAARRSGIIEISDPIEIKQLDTVRR